MIKRIIGIVMILTLFLTPFVINYGLKTTCFTVLIIVLIISWFLIAVWLMASNHKMPK